MAKRKADDVEKPTKKPTKTQGATQISVCIPTTAISSKNAVNLQQITAIAYQIAKASTTYNVVEIVVLDVAEQVDTKPKEVVELGSKGGKKMKFNFSDEDIVAPKEAVQQPQEPATEAAYLLASLLQYFVTPPYLVKSTFSAAVNSKNKDVAKKFKYAQNLPKITTLPFMSNNDVYRDFKEGITISRETPKIMKKKEKVKNPHKISVTKYVNIGEAEPLELNIKREVPVNSRVTVDLKNKTIVSPLEAYGVVGNKSSFGYYIRMSKRFSSVFTESSVAEGYSSSIYVNCDDFFNSNDKFDELKQVPELELAKLSPGNVLLVLGNYKDLQASFKQDKANLEGVENVGQMFDGQLAVPKGVRIEDGLLIALTKVSE